MNGLQEKEKIFIETFSHLDTSDYDLPCKIDLPIHNKFLTNEIGIKYISNRIKNIDIKLYLTFQEMLKNSIEFIDNYDIEESVCKIETHINVTKDVKINVPKINNSLDIFATGHELGHGIKQFTKLNNKRHLYSHTIFDETVSILFGKIFLNRYINDFGYDIYAQQFELLNILNAIQCLKQIKILLPEYTKKHSVLENTTEKMIENNTYADYKYYSFTDEIKHLKNELYTLISYPLGISLVNVYDNFNEIQKNEYLNFVCKYLLNSKHINFEMILEYFDIPFNAEYYINNFEEYINKFEKDNKILILGGK